MKRSSARLLGAMTLSLAALIGCRELNDIRHAGPAGAPPARTSLRLGEPGAKFGMHGYQPALGASRTGDGQMATAGLPARGGGPPPTAAPSAQPEVYGLAPDQRIGTPTRPRELRVITDPVTRATTALP